MKLKNIHVLGLDDFNRSQLEALKGAERFRVHELLANKTVKRYDKVSITEMLEQAEKALADAAEPPDAIITWWDFPATILQAILTTRHGLPGPSLESIMKCEHKYWSRRIQKEVADDVMPSFAAINPFDPPAYDDLEIKVPFWIKPVKGTDSMLAYRVESEDDYTHALDGIRKRIEIIAKPFNEVLKLATLPRSISGVDGYHCLAEGTLKGTQHTITGYVYQGRVKIYGLVDSLHYPGKSSFFRYEYPSALSEEVSQRMADISTRVVERIGLDNCAFNIEFFYDESQDRATILEVNPRISQSHSDIFYKVDGKSDERLIVELGLGEDLGFPYREGRFACAAKFYYRRFEDGFVRSVPDENTIAELKKEFPDTLIHITAEEGHNLSDAWEHDSYSYVLATIFTGADSSEELVEKYERIVSRLPFEFDAPR